MANPGQRGGLVQDGIEDSLRYFTFHKRGFFCLNWRGNYGRGYAWLRLSRLGFKNLENGNGSERKGCQSQVRPQHRLVPKSALNGVPERGPARAGPLSVETQLRSTSH